MHESPLSSDFSSGFLPCSDSPEKDAEFAAALAAILVERFRRKMSAKIAVYGSLHDYTSYSTAFLKASQKNAFLFYHENHSNFREWGKRKK